MTYSFQWKMKFTITKYIEKYMYLGEKVKIKKRIKNAINNIKKY